MPDLVSAELVRRRSEPLAQFEPYGEQAGFVLSNAPVRFVRGGNRVGKAQPLSELIVTPGGFRTIGSLKVGGIVFDETGAQTGVVGVFPQGRKQVYRFIFDDGAQTVCSAHHLWKVKTRASRFPRPGRTGDYWEVLPAWQILAQWGAGPAPVQRVAVPVPAPLQFPKKLLPLDPYFLGALIGDGSFTQGQVSFSSGDAFMFDELARLGLSHWRMSGNVERGERIWRAAEGGRELRRILETLGLQGCRSWQKVIPDLYLFSHPDQQAALLQGLMDTDGSACEGGHAEFCSTSKVLAEQVAFIVRTHGGKARLVERTTQYTYRGEKKDGRVSYRVHIKYPGPLFRLPRKADRYFFSTARRCERLLVKIEDAGQEECVCIAVSSPKRTYVTAQGVVTHNSMVGAYEMAARLLDQHPHQHYGRSIRAWAVAPGWDQIGAYLWPKLKQFIPARYIADASYFRRSHPEIPTDIKLVNGSTLAFKSADAAPEKFASDDIDFAWIDEEIDEGRADEVGARLIDRAGRLVVTFTPIRSLAWMREWERNETAQVFRLRMTENPHIDQGAVSRFLAGKGEMTRRKREAGEYAMAEGLVYGLQADEETSENYLWPVDGALVDRRGVALYPWPLPDSWPRHGGVDFGFTNPSVLLGAASDFDGRLIVHHCMYQAQVRTSLWAREQRAALQLDRLNWRNIYADPAAADQREELHAAGILTQAADNRIVAGLERVQDRLELQADGRPRLYLVLPVCQPGLDEAGKYRYPNSTTSTRKDLPVDADNHFWDALRYLVMGAGAEQGSVPVEELFGFGGKRK